MISDQNLFKLCLQLSLHQNCCLILILINRKIIRVLISSLGFEFSSDSFEEKNKRELINSLFYCWPIKRLTVLNFFNPNPVRTL